MLSARKDLDLFRFMLARYLVIDVAVGLGLVALWLLLYEVRDLHRAVLICAGLNIVRILLWIAILRAKLAPARSPWPHDTSAKDLLRQREARLQRLPAQIAASLSIGWLAYYVGLTALAWWVVPDVIHLGRAELLAAALQTTSVALGSWMIYLMLGRAMLDAPIAAIDRQLQLRDLDVRRPRTPLGRRFIAVGVTLACIPSIWYGSMAWLDHCQLTREAALAKLALEVRDSPVERLMTLEHADLELVVAVPEGFDDADAPTPARVDTRSERVAVAAPVAGGWLVIERDIDYHQGAFLRDFGLLLVIAAVWGAAMIRTQSHTILEALERLGHATRRMVEVGDLRTMGRLPVVNNDEIGDSCREFNRMLETYGALATAAERIARGDLAVEVHGTGDLPDNFAIMVVQLRDLVVRLRETTTSLTDAAHEIGASIHDLELAAEQQGKEMSALARGMSLLTDSAAQIDDSSSGVLSNAEQALSNADETAIKMRALGERIKSIGALLDQIREIADRSNLIALNGSLEATRAGEAGRGFTLIAGEMRRLAERISGMVNDAHEFVSDINTANLSTAETTDRSRAIAEAAAAAARAITEQVQHQWANTERTSTNVREVAGILSHTASATQHTRMIAVNLSTEASHLEEILSRFHVDASVASERVQSVC